MIETFKRNYNLEYFFPYAKLLFDLTRELCKFDISDFGYRTAYEYCTLGVS